MAASQVPNQNPHRIPIVTAYESLTDTAKLRVVDLLEAELLRMGSEQAQASLGRCRNEIDAHTDLTARLFEFLIKAEQVVLRDCSEKLRSEFPPLSYRTVERMDPAPLRMVIEQIQTELEKKGHPGLAAEAVDFQIELQRVINDQQRGGMGDE